MLLPNESRGLVNGIAVCLNGFRVRFEDLRPVRGGQGVRRAAVFAEVAVHPAVKNGAHELYLMCDDINSFVAEMNGRGVECTEIFNRGWGLLTQITLPGGGKLGVYQPQHARP